MKVFKCRNISINANAVAMIQILAGMVIILVINFAYSVSFKKEKH
jgi:raffinose/stachyose/melibiose transport system permease protein